ncbi:MAG: MCE family protein [Lentisphaeria bacterium]|nr:MCE family protein [Lentisphaeria bacterium]
MKGNPNRGLIGLFVLLGLGLGVAGVLVFGGSRVFRRSIPYVMYFQGAVKGLAEGAPVTFRGVKIGTVDEIRVMMDDAGELRISVYVTVDVDAVATRRRFRAKSEAVAYFDRMIRQEGLRAQLRLQSILTGQLLVELDFHPEVEARLVGADPEVREIPTMRSGLEVLSQSVEELPLDLIVERLLNAIEGINRLVNSTELYGSIEDLGTIVDDLRVIVADTREEIGPLTDDLLAAVKALREVIESIGRRIDPLGDRIEGAAAGIQRLAGTIDDSVQRITPEVERSADALTGALDTARETLDSQTGPVADLLETLSGAVTTADTALAQARETLAGLDTTLGPRSALPGELTQTLSELRETARSLRLLLDYLQRHPEALLRGKGQPGKE